MEKNDILKNIKLLENRLSQINKDNNEMLDKNNNCFDYFKRICKDMMANIEVILVIRNNFNFAIGKF